jgi:hypothetical protein
MFLTVTDSLATSSSTSKIWLSELCSLICAGGAGGASAAGARGAWQRMGPANGRAGAAHLGRHGAERGEALRSGGPSRGGAAEEPRGRRWARWARGEGEADERVERGASAAGSMRERLGGAARGGFMASPPRGTRGPRGSRLPSTACPRPSSQAAAPVGPGTAACARAQREHRCPSPTPGPRCAAPPRRPPASRRRRPAARPVGRSRPALAAASLHLAPCLRGGLATSCSPASPGPPQRHATPSITARTCSTPSSCASPCSASSPSASPCPSALARRLGAVQVHSAT